MKEKSKDELERMEKLKEAFLYNIGYEHSNNICEETDQLIEEYNDLEVPESLNEWFLEYKRDYDRKKRWNKVRGRSILVGKRIAIIILMISITFGVISISVEAFRVKFFNIIVETRKHFSSMKLEENYYTEYISDLPKTWKNFYYPEILPQGYKFNKAFNVNDTKYIIFSNNQGEELYFVQGFITADFQLDTENSNIIEVDINGMEGLIINKKGSNIISWHDNNYSYYIQGSVETPILLKIAESVVKN